MGALWVYISAVIFLVEPLGMRNRNVGCHSLILRIEGVRGMHRNDSVYIPAWSENPSRRLPIKGLSSLCSAPKGIDLYFGITLSDGLLTELQSPIWDFVFYQLFLALSSAAALTKPVSFSIFRLALRLSSQLSIPFIPRHDRWVGLKDWMIFSIKWKTHFSFSPMTLLIWVFWVCRVSPTIGFWWVEARGAAKHVIQCIRWPCSKELFGQNVCSAKKTSQTTFDMFDQSQHLLQTLHKSFFAFQLHFYLSWNNKA